MNSSNVFRFVSSIVMLFSVACVNEAATTPDTTTAAGSATTTTPNGGAGGGATTSVGGHHQGGAAPTTTTTKPAAGGSGPTSSDPGTGTQPSNATTILMVMFVGNPAGQYVDLRNCLGSPVAKGDLRDDTEAQFLPWPHQNNTPTPVNDLATWLDLGNSVVNGNGVYKVQTPPVWVDEDFRLQCYDWKGGKVTFGCAKILDGSVTVTDENGKGVSLTSVENLTEKGWNCQTSH